MLQTYRRAGDSAPMAYIEVLTYMLCTVLRCTRDCVLILYTGLDDALAEYIYIYIYICIYIHIHMHAHIQFIDRPVEDKKMPCHRMLNVPSC